MLTLMYITIHNTVHSKGSKESKDAHFDVYYNWIVQYIQWGRKSRKMLTLILQYTIQLTFNRVERVERVKRCSFWYTLQLHTINGYNFLNNDPIFNCFTPLESSSMSSIHFWLYFVSFDSFDLNAYTALYNQAISFDSFDLCSNIEELKPEMNRGD